MTDNENAPGLREQATGANDHLAGGSLHMVPHREDTAQRWRPFGLSATELRAEITRCIDCGWRGWEIRARFFRAGERP